MTLRHPFGSFSTSGQKWAFIALLILTLMVMAGLNALNGPLKTKVAPAGIVSFELAGDLSQTQRILESWGPTGRINAGLSLGLDYLFLVAYASCIALGCLLVARAASQRLRLPAGVGMGLAWALFGAGLLDMVENYALIQLLLGSQRAWWPKVARWCALPKFLIVALGIVYVGIGFLAVVVVNVRADSTPQT
jgi:hypothetical protein